MINIYHHAKVRLFLALATFFIAWAASPRASAQSGDKGRENAPIEKPTLEPDPLYEMYLEEEAAKEKEAESFEESMIRRNLEFASKIDAMAESIDLFFAGEKVTDKKNNSSLRLRYYGHKTEGQDYDDKPKVDFVLRLPNTEEQWSLKFTTDEDEEFRSLDTKRPGAAPGPQRYGVSVGLVKKLGDFDVNFRPGLKLRDPVETSYLLSFTNRVNIRTLSLRPRFDFFADSNRGTGQKSSFDIDYELSDRYVLRLSNQQQYLDIPRIFSTNHVPGILFKKSDRVSYSGSVGIYSTNEGTFHLDSYSLVFSRRQEIYKGILFYQISPSWAFPKGNDFKPIGDIALNIDVIF